jgi:nucleotide-binding universal stress UspA family protein
MSRGPIGYIKTRLGMTAHREETQLTRISNSSGAIATHDSLVVGHDRQPESVDALDVAMDFANRLNASLHIVHIVNLSDYPIDPDSADWETYASERLAEEKAMVAEALRDHQRSWSYYVGRGDPARRLMRVAQENDALMIIVGSHGEGVHTWASRLVEPAVSHHLIQQAHCPVLVVGHSYEGSDRRRVLHAVVDTD